jgi:lantibiotic biosynthesis protein
MSWKPILEGDKLIRAKIIIDSIIKTTPASYIDRSLMYGKGGIVLWLAYLGKYTNDPQVLRNSENIFNELLNELSDFSDQEFSFGKGAIGNSWVLAHLIRLGVLTVPEDFFSDVIPEFENAGLRMIHEGNYDYILAGLGAVLFFLEIGEKTPSERIFEQLKANSIAIGNGITWRESPIIRNKNAQEEAYNFGLAHGVPGIISIFGLLHINGVCSEDSLSLIRKTGNWLLSNSFTFEKSLAKFPFSAGNNETPFPTSIRWCYGDLGIAYSLYITGKNTNIKSLEFEGLELAKNCILRNSESKDIVDAHLCHGTAGIAHIYNRFYNHTSDEIFRDAAIFWFDETFKRFNPDLIFGFRAWKGPEHGWQNFSGLLEGSAGIGLALISAISEVEPKWDRCLLLS